MANDVRDVTANDDQEGRLRGFDNVNDEDYENDTFEEESSDGEQNEVLKLKREVDPQATIIKELRDELARNRVSEEAIQNQAKRRKIEAEKRERTV